MALSSVKKNSSEIVKNVCTLVILLAVVITLLAVVSAFSSNEIDCNVHQKREKSMKTILPEAVEFEDLTESVLEKWDGRVDVLSVYAGKNDMGEFVGYCIEVGTRGYLDVIKMMVGVNAVGEIISTNILEISDTPNTGTQVTHKEFLEQFSGKSGILTTKKGGTSSKNEVELISGATSSSSAVLYGVNASLAIYDLICEEGLK